MTFTLGTYKTREAAEAACKMWAEIYGDEQLSIVFTGTAYLLHATTDEL